MRADEFFGEQPQQVWKLIAVPIRCLCLVTIRPDRYQSFNDHIQVQMNGILIKNARCEVLRYVSRQTVEVEFTGTIPIFDCGIEPAIRSLSSLPIHFSGGWIDEKPLEMIELTVSGEIVSLTPSGGKLFSLVAADRVVLGGRMHRQNTPNTDDSTIA